ncbi:MAG: methionine adenosyltransferase [archaeon]
MKKLFTSECVTKGHPDKIADQISDAILDAMLQCDPNCRSAVETFVTTGQVVVGGEVSTNCYVDVQEIIRDVIKRIGYTNSNLKFTDSCGIFNSIHEQSSDIAMGVDIGGAGDQGMMFGGAVNETKSLMPLPISIARDLTNKYSYAVDNNIIDWGRPDGKSQVTVEYNELGQPIGINTIVMSVQHDPNILKDQIEEVIKLEVIQPVLMEYGYTLNNIKTIHINPTGKFIIGGPHGDTGLTGRKIIVDTYGGYFSHGGGAFSGKDATKVDRSGAYMARYLAKNIVAAKFAEKCEIQLSYAIGIAEPVSINVNTFDTGIVNENKIVDILYELVDMTPKGIIKKFQLQKPTFSYENLAAHGHFGRLFCPWEKTDLVDKLKKYEVN